MENSTHPTFANGKICYIEIPSINTIQSSTFYKEVFGWRIRDDNHGNISFDDSVGEVSGTWVVGPKPSTEIGFVISIMVDNIQETIELIRSKGGEIIMVDIDSPEKIARFTDPAGNIVGLYQG